MDNSKTNSNKPRQKIVKKDEHSVSVPGEKDLSEIVDAVLASISTDNPNT